MRGKRQYKKRAGYKANETLKEKRRIISRAPSAPQRPKTQLTDSQPFLPPSRRQNGQAAVAQESQNPPRPRIRYNTRKNRIAFVAEFLQISMSTTDN